MQEESYSRSELVSKELENHQDLFKFDDCRYYITIPLHVGSIEKNKIWPEFGSVIIQTCWKGQEKKPVCITSDRKDNTNVTDREHFGGFVFLLAAKLKYDFICTKSYDKAGFLHYSHIVNLIKDKHGKKRADLPITIYGSLKRLVRWASEAQENNDIGQERKEHLRFLNRVFFEPSQLWHLICYGGNTTNKNLLWWLNVPQEYVVFKNENGEDIDDDILKILFSKLFPPSCLTQIDNSNKKELDNILARKSRAILTINASIERKEILQQEIVQILRSKLIQEAKQYFEIKLNSRDDYQPLNLEIGVVGNPHPTEFIEHLKFDMHQQYEHDRNWHTFKLKNLLNPIGVYILSSDVGTGKTTFLRHLQLELLNNKNIVPLFLHAGEIEHWNYTDIDTFVFILVEEKLKAWLPDTNCFQVLKDIFLSRFILLVDGLDQITGIGTDYNKILGKLLLIFKNRLIVASRPSAVVSQQNNPSVNFLRLQPFDRTAQKAYFREHFQRACQICPDDLRMLGVPMLAYMVRAVIEKGKDKDITTRASLYRNFIDYVLEEYDHEESKLAEGERAYVRAILQEISYKAMAVENPFLQKVPINSCCQFIKDYQVVDRLCKYGLVNLIVDTCKETIKCVYFTHQSFQEYLAAVYVSQSDDEIQKVLTEKWNLKWKEVIKFLAGIMGQVIIERILSENDNIINSKLLLAAELVPEVPFISSKLKNRITQKLESLLDNSVFETDARDCLLFFNPARILEGLVDNLEDKNEHIVLIAIATLNRLEDHRAVYKWIVERIADKLEDKSEKVVSAAIRALGEWKDHEGISKEIVERITDKLEDEREIVVRSALEVLKEFKDHQSMNHEIIGKIARKLMDRKEKYVCTSLQALGELEDHEGISKEIVERITDKLEDKSEKVVCTALRALRGLNNHKSINQTIIEKIVSKLDDRRENVVSCARTVLCDYKNHKSINQTIIEKIVSKLDDKRENVACTAIWVLTEYKDHDSMIKAEIVKSIETVPFLN